MSAKRRSTGDERPEDTRAEQALLGALLLDFGTAWPEVAGRIELADFHAERHRAIFDAIRADAAAGRTADVLTISERLAAAGTLDAAGGLAYLGELARDTPAATNAPHYADLVRERGTRRSLIRAIRERLESCESGASTPAELAEHVGAELARTLERSTPARDATIAEAAVTALEEFDARRERRAAGGIVGIPTGLPRLDALLGGLQPGGLVVAAGLTATGKTTLALNIAHAAARAGFPTGFVSREMLAHELAARLLAMHHGAPLGPLMYGEPGALATLMRQDRGDTLGRLPIYLDDQAARLEEIAARIGTWRRRHGVRLVVLDYLQLVSAPGAENRTLEIAAITRRLKTIALRERLAVLALSQFNRGAAAGAALGDRPELHQLRDSGAVEQDSDAVLLLWRTRAQRAADEFNRPRQLMLSLAKNRHGPAGDVYGERNPLVFETTTQRFRELGEADAPATERPSSRPTRARRAGGIPGATFADRSRPDASEETNP